MIKGNIFILYSSKHFNSHFCSHKSLEFFSSAKLANAIEKHHNPPDAQARP